MYDMFDLGKSGNLNSYERALMYEILSDTGVYNNYQGEDLSCSRLKQKSSLLLTPTYGQKYNRSSPIRSRVEIGLLSAFFFCSTPIVLCALIDSVDLSSGAGIVAALIVAVPVAILFLVLDILLLVALFEDMWKLITKIRKSKKRSQKKSVLLS